ncbi:MAG: hypothetical protein ACYTFG_05395, partial [Planctomycetota bacterium]
MAEKKVREGIPSWASWLGIALFLAAAMSAGALVLLYGKAGYWLPLSNPSILIMGVVIGIMLFVGPRFIVEGAVGLPLRDASKKSLGRLGGTVFAFSVLAVLYLGLFAAAEFVLPLTEDFRESREIVLDPVTGAITITPVDNLSRWAV